MPSKLPSHFLTTANYLGTCMQQIARLLAKKREVASCKQDNPPLDLSDSSESEVLVNYMEFEVPDQLAHLEWKS